MINTYIKQYKQQGVLLNKAFEEGKDVTDYRNFDYEQFNQAFNGIYNKLRYYIESIVRDHNIPGCDKDDLRSIAAEQIHDCLFERALARGKGTKVVLSENDTDEKNIRLFKNAIKYRIYREKRKAEANIEYTYNMDILDENDNMYLDREGKPLNIGINFVHGLAYLYEGKKRTKIILNIPYFKNTRTVKSSQAANPLDNSVSFDFTTETEDNDDCIIRDILEFEHDKNIRDTTHDYIDLEELKQSIFNIFQFTDEQKQTITMLLANSYSTNALKQCVSQNKQEVLVVKSLLKKAFKKMGMLK